VSEVDPILTAAEVAADLRVSKSHVYKLMDGEVDGAGPLSHLTIGRRKLVPRSALEKWKRENLSGMISGHSSEKNTVTHPTEVM
jgi:excisionase family DNA binding protein